MRKIVNVSYNFYYGSRSPRRQQSPYRRVSHSNAFIRCRSPYRRITPRQRHTNPFERCRSPRRRRVSERGSSPVECIFSRFGREISPFRRDEFVRDVSPFRRDVSPFRRDANPFAENAIGRDTSPFGRDISPFGRDTTPFRENATGRDASPFTRRSTWFGRNGNGYGRNASPFERHERNDNPGERNGSPLGRDWSQHRRDSRRPDEREWSLSRRDSTPPRTDRPKFKINRQKRWLTRRPRFTNRQLAAYYRKIGKLMILRRNATKMMKRSLTGEIRALIKLSRAVRGLPLNRKRMNMKKFDQTTKSDDDDALLNEPDAFEFID